MIIQCNAEDQLQRQLLELIQYVIDITSCPGAILRARWRPVPAPPRTRACSTRRRL